MAPAGSRTGASWREDGGWTRREVEDAGWVSALTEWMIKC
jgi:hypothetical protein